MIAPALEAAWPGVKVAKLRVAFQEDTDASGEPVERMDLHMVATGSPEALIASGLVTAEDFATLPASELRERCGWALRRGPRWSRLTVSVHDSAGEHRWPGIARALSVVAAAVSAAALAGMREASHG